MFSCGATQGENLTENKRLRMLNLGNTAYATTESSQHCFLSVQMRKHLLWKQTVSEKNQKHFLFLGNKEVSAISVSCISVRAQTGKRVSSTMFSRLQGPQEGKKWAKDTKTKNVSPRSSQKNFRLT